MREKNHRPYRMCIVCRRRFPKKDLNRFVRINSHQEKKKLKPDPEQQLPGRGYYLCSNPDCHKKFQKFRVEQKKSRG